MWWNGPLYSKLKRLIAWSFGRIISPITLLEHSFCFKMHHKLYIGIFCGQNDTPLENALWLVVTSAVCTLIFKSSEFPIFLTSAATKLNFNHVWGKDEALSHVFYTEMHKHCIYIKREVSKPMIRGKKARKLSLLGRYSMWYATD